MKNAPEQAGSGGREGGEGWREGGREGGRERESHLMLLLACHTDRHQFQYGCEEEQPVSCVP